METHKCFDKETYLEQLRQLEIIKGQLADEKYTSQQGSVDVGNRSEQILVGCELQSHNSVWLENTAYEQLQRELEYYRHNHTGGDE